MRPDADTEPEKSVGAERACNGGDALVPAGSLVKRHPGSAERQVGIVMNDEHSQRINMPEDAGEMLAGLVHVAVTDGAGDDVRTDEERADPSLPRSDSTRASRDARARRRSPCRCCAACRHSRPDSRDRQEEIPSSPSYHTKRRSQSFSLLNAVFPLRCT